MKNIINPLTRKFSTADPFMTYDEQTGYYYAICTSYELVIRRSKHAADIIENGEKKTVYGVEPHNKTYGHYWAPEMYKAPNGKWYIYTSTLQTLNEPPSLRLWRGRKCIIVLESNTEDPFDGFHFKSRPFENVYAIDPSCYFDKDGKQYICYSNAEHEQVLEIREMINPWTATEKKAVICQAQFDWEIWKLNEGPFFVDYEGKLCIVYSYNGAYQNEYGLAVLEYVGGDLCDKNSWKKHDTPLLTYGNGVYGPGHASFFLSPDKTQLWCAYHALEHENSENNHSLERILCLQKMQTDGKGNLLPCHPAPWDVPLAPPSGEK